MDVKKQLSEAVRFAEESGSFSKINLAESADIVCAYGLGTFFREAFVQWDFKNKMHVDLLCDSDPRFAGGVYEGLKCVSPEELFALSKTKRVLVIPFIGNPVEVNKMLRENSVSYVNANDCIFEMIADMERSREWFRKNNIMEVFDWLSDEESQRVYANVLCNRIAPHLSCFDYNDLYSEGEYFETDAFGLGAEEYYVDCGAYNGDTIERMLDVTGGQAGHIYGFEMDKDNYLDLQKKTAELSRRYHIQNGKIELFNAGVWNVKGELPYGKETFGSKESFSLLKSEVTDYAKLVRIDDLLEGQKVTLIKMDIEGAETKALEGARNVISVNKPKLAVCLYHRLQDFWEIPTFVKPLVSDYKIYVRHHQNGTFGGTVMYAVCDVTEK